MPTTSMPSGKTFWTRRSAFARFPKAVGQDPLTIFGKKVGLASTRKASRTQKLERLFPTQNLTGVAGGNPRAHFPKLTPVNFGRLRYRPMPLSTPVTTVNPTTLTAPERASCLPMRSAVKIETCPTSGCGPITPNLWPNSTAFPMPTAKPSPRRYWMARLVSMKTRCPENWQTSFLVVLPTCWICKVPITPWMLHALHQWPPFWMRAACCRHDRSTSCLQALPTEPWTRPPLRNFPPSGRSRHRTPRPLMHEPTDS